MSEELNKIQNEEEEIKESSFKEYIHNVINELKEQREYLFKELEKDKSSLEYLEYLIYLNPDDDEPVVVEERQNLREEIESFEEEKENLRDKILFYGILENANNPEEVVSEYRENNKIDDAEAEAVLNFLHPKLEESEIIIPKNLEEKTEENFTVKKEIAEEAAGVEIKTAPEIEAVEIKNEENEEEDDDEESIEDIIANLPEEKRAAFNKTKPEIAVSVSFLEYRKKMEKERDVENSKRKAEFLKNDIQKLEKDAEEARNNRDYKSSAKIEKDIMKLRKKLWWHLTPEDRESLRITEKEEREAAERQYKKAMKGSGISGSRGNGGEDDSRYEDEKLRPSGEELGLASEIQKLTNKAVLEYKKMSGINKRIKGIKDNKKSEILKRILAEKFESLRELFWHINYVKNEVIKLHNQKEWEKENYFSNGHIKENIGPEVNWLNIEKEGRSKIKPIKKTAIEFAFDKLGGGQNVKEKLGLIEKENKKIPIKGIKKIKKSPAVKSGVKNNT